MPFLFKSARVRQNNMNSRIIREIVIIVIIALFSFILAKEFYNDPLLVGGIGFFSIPLYTIIVFFIPLYIIYKVICFASKIIRKIRVKS